MFKKKAQSAANRNVRRPGQALEDTDNIAAAGNVASSLHQGNAEDRKESIVNGSAEAGADSDGDDDDTTAVRRPAKRQRQQLEQHSSRDTKPAAAAAETAVVSPSLTDPTLISISSSRSVQPDTSTHSHQHTRYAPKQPPTTATATPTAATLSLPSAQPPPSARFGPQRANGYARAISRIDFQPDVCKDWKECGSCGYGDSCKFLHDRLDYKAGWQIEREWEEEQKKIETKRKEDAERRARGETVAAESGAGGGSGKVGLPFACYICRQKFSQPVVTVCGHYFCERCALQRYVKTSRCAVCGKETQGSFSIARELLKETALPSDGSEVSDDEG